MKIKLQIKDRFTGEILFEFEKENNTLRETVEKAVKQKADLRSANLRSANLRSADLSSADLRSADLSSADLRSADLSSANLRSADLSSANLRSADLSFANLSFANLRFAKNKNPVMILLAYWGEVSPKLCLELMRYDCANLPNGKKLFDNWAKGKSCPYSSTEWQRVANFQENKRLWKYGKSKTALQLCEMLIKEKTKSPNRGKKSR